MRGFLAASLLGCLLGPAALFADDPADGHLVIRIKEIDSEAVARIDLQNVDTGELVKVRTGKCKSAGIDSRICLVPAAPGRYFWSRFEIEYKLRGAASQLEVPGVRRTQPGSADDSVEVVANVINYVGDWELVNIRPWHEPLDMREYSVEIHQVPETLQLIFERFPDAAGEYEIYLSMLGKSAISLRDFLKLVEKQSE